MKIAKMEIKMILALVLCRYDYKLVDGAGKPVKQAPQLNGNDNQQVWQFVDLLVWHLLSQLLMCLEETYGRAMFPSVHESRGVGRWLVLQCLAFVGFGSII
jgi:hypothetical protein